MNQTADNASLYAWSLPVSTTAIPARTPDYSAIVARAEELVGQLASDVLGQVKRLGPASTRGVQALRSESAVACDKPRFEPVARGFVPTTCLSVGCAFAGGVVGAFDSGSYGRRLPTGLGGLAGGFIALSGGHASAPNLGTPFHQQVTLAREVLGQLMRTLPAEVRAQYADRLAAASARVTTVTDAVVALTAGDIDGAIAGTRNLQ